jgi:hypothetical protein
MKFNLKLNKILSEQIQIKNDLAIEKVIESLSRLMTTPSDSMTVNTTIEALKWISHLVNKQPDNMLSHIDDFFLILISFLSDPSKEAVELDLQILATVSSSPFFLKTNNQDDYLKVSFAKYNNYFTKFMRLLLDLFRNDVNLRYEKGSIIIKFV